MVLAFRQALRRLGKSSGFTIVCTLMLALGIAISTAAFSVANDTMLRPMPLPHPEKLVRVFTTSRKIPLRSLTPGSALDLRDEFGDIGDFGLFTPRMKNVAEQGRPPEQRFGLTVTPNVLKLLGVLPVLGRDFVQEDGNTGMPAVTILTDRFWRDHYASDPGVLGKILRIDGVECTIIGVLPPRFDEPLLWYGCSFVNVMQVWPDWRQERLNAWLEVMGRLKPGVSLAAMQVRLDALAARFAHDYPEKFGTNGFRVTPLGSSKFGPQARTLCWLVVGLAALVLAIACANLGGLQLARALRRRSEMAVHVALGATQRHLIPPLALEGAIIAVAGTALGILSTFWARSLLGLWFVGPPVTIDWRVLGFAAFAGVFATMVFSLVPAWLMARNSMAEAMKDSSRSATLGRSQNRLKFILIAGQVGLALVLLTAAATVVFGVRNFLRRDRGWQPEGLVAGAFQIPWSWRQKESAHPILVRQLEAKLGALPGVQQASVDSEVTIYGGQWVAPVTVEGADPVPAGHEPQAMISAVDAAFFSVVGIQLQKGHLFPAEWRETDPPVAVVSASTARLLWPRGDALGKRIRVPEDKRWHEVVGIVADANFSAGFNTPPTTLQIYRPAQERNGPWFSFVLKSSLPASTLEHSIRQIISSVDPDFMVVGVGDAPRKLAEFVSTPLTPILAAFAVAGLAIAMIGLYSVMNQFTLQRRRDIGVRMALGASYRHVILLMLRQGGRFLAVGIVIGTAGSYAVVLTLRNAMPELPPLGIGLQLLIGLGLGVVGLGACYLPSRRAASLNPADVLRAE